MNLVRKVWHGEKVNKDEVNGQGEHKKIEDHVIILANAVIDPLAVMIESIDALIANVAVPRVFGVDRLTVRTKPLGFILFN